MRRREDDDAAAQRVSGLSTAGVARADGLWERRRDRAFGMV